MRLPEPRGPIGEQVLAALGSPAHDLGDDIAPAPAPDALLDEDLNLSLYVLYELHYRSFDDVDEAWEWEPSLIAVRGRLERAFEAALRAAVGPPAAGVADVPAELTRMLAATGGPSLSRFIEHEASLEQFREFVVHRSAYQLKENDPHSFALPRLDGRPKVAMAEIQADEFGGGRPERLHARLFADTMEALDLDGRYGAYLDTIPAVSLASVNAMSLFGLHRRLRGAAVGHLAMLEMDSSIPNRRYADGLRRLGQAAATAFYDEHVEADAVHEQVAVHDLAGALAADEPALAPDIVLGAGAAIVMDELLGDHLLDSWQRGQSSLRRPVAAALSA